MNQNGGIHKGGFAVLCHRNGGSESPGILSHCVQLKYALQPIIHYVKIIRKGGHNMYAKEKLFRLYRLLQYAS